MADVTSSAERFDALLLLVGRLNYTWSNTESLLIHLIAGLAGTDKETAVVIFLTLNTTRARIDLVERLAKLDRTPADRKARVLGLTSRVMRCSALRNRYSHSIYAVDPETGDMRTIMMRIADRKSDIKMGRAETIDASAIKDIDDAILEISNINREFWSLIRDYAYPV